MFYFDQSGKTHKKAHTQKNYHWILNFGCLKIRINLAYFSYNKDIRDSYMLTDDKCVIFDDDIFVFNY